MKANIDLTNRLYKVGDAVYFGYKASFMRKELFTQFPISDKDILH